MQQLLKHYQHILNIQNWEIQLLEEENMSDRGAVNMLYNDYRATIKISKELNDEEKERSLIHELLHLVHRDELDIAQDNLEENLSQLYVRYHERSIEQMSKIVYNLCKQIYKEEK